jgi:hypothetical protein
MGKTNCISVVCTTESGHLVRRVPSSRRSANLPWIPAAETLKSAPEPFASKELSKSYGKSYSSEFLPVLRHIPQELCLYYPQIISVILFRELCLTKMANKAKLASAEIKMNLQLEKINSMRNGEPTTPNHIRHFRLFFCLTQDTASFNVELLYFCENVFFVVVVCFGGGGCVFWRVSLVRGKKMVSSMCNLVNMYIKSS